MSKDNGVNHLFVPSFKTTYNLWWHGAPIGADPRDPQRLRFERYQSLRQQGLGHVEAMADLEKTPRTSLNPTAPTFKPATAPAEAAGSRQGTLPSGSPLRPEDRDADIDLNKLQAEFSPSRQAARNNPGPLIRFQPPEEVPSSGHAYGISHSNPSEAKAEQQQKCMSTAQASDSRAERLPLPRPTTYESSEAAPKINHISFQTIQKNASAKLDRSARYGAGPLQGLTHANVAAMEQGLRRTGTGAVRGSDWGNFWQDLPEDASKEAWNKVRRHMRTSANHGDYWADPSRAPKQVANVTAIPPAPSYRPNLGGGNNLPNVIVVQQVRRCVTMLLSPRWGFNDSEGKVAIGLPWVCQVVPRGSMGQPSGGSRLALHPYSYVAVHALEVGLPQEYLDWLLGRNNSNVLIVLRSWLAEALRRVVSEG